MAGHSGLYSKALPSYGKQVVNMDKAGFARAAFPTVDGERERGNYGRALCSLVALDSLVRKSRGHSGAIRSSSFLGKGER